MPNPQMFIPARSRKKGQTSMSKMAYGIPWPVNLPDLFVELSCINAGGSWTRKGKPGGEGIYAHHMKASALLWPELDDHRWHQLCLKAMTENRITVLLGPGSSGKTNEAAKFALTEYFAAPNETTVLISSTDLRGLELRIWGEIKKLWQMARDRHDGIPGYLIDSKHCISTDNIQEDDVRDLRNGIIGIPCFPSGTLVDTLQGPVPIEQIRVGQKVINAVGVGNVTDVHSSVSSSLVRVHINDGRIIDCTPEHPFLTERGWVNAVDLVTLDRVLSEREALQVVQQTNRSRVSEQEVLYGCLSGFPIVSSMSSMRNDVSSQKAKTIQSKSTLLQQNLCFALGCSQQMYQTDHSEVCPLWKYDEACSLQPDFLFCKMPHEADDSSMSHVRKEFYIGTRISKQETIRFLQQVLQSEGSWSEQWPKTSQNNHARNGCLETIFRKSHYALSFENRRENQGWKISLVPNGHSFSGFEAGHRNRWWNTSGAQKEIQGQFTHEHIAKAWVERVEILELGSRKGHLSGGQNNSVYNLSVDGHPSYSVNGLIVHNCIVGNRFIGLGKYVGIKNKRVRLIADEAQFMQASFLESFSNLEKNPDFKAVILGNPLDPLDSLGKAAEPKDGWASIGEPEKTTTWKTRFKDGICVNLVGTDSPNFDFPQDEPPRYPYLICQSSIDSTVSFYGKRSQQYFTQCVGIMKTGLVSRRVITQAMCRQFHAYDPVVWLNTKRTKIYAIDAAYGNIGGDRCVGCYFEFGKDVNNRTVIEAHAPVIIPVTYQLHGPIPEDQIADFVRIECENLGIPPENVYFDATGRGSLGTSFARIWSAQVNPVEFGGTPSLRPVCQDIFIIDEKTKYKRLKLCTEHYSKFVTELWFSVRYVIESDQMRGLTTDVVEEGCQREWKIVRGNKIEIETKVEMKERTGRSPDLFDNLSIGLEGARRRGFQISKLANEMPSKANETIKELIRKQRLLVERGRLNYSV